MSVTSLAPEASASANFATIAEGTWFGSLHPLDKLDNRRVREMSQLEISVHELFDTHFWPRNSEGQGFVGL